MLLQAQSQDEVRGNLIASMKVAISWILSIQPQEVAIWLSIIYTSALLYVLIRDKVIRKPRRRKEIVVETDSGEL
jgi:hypothetical protein